jgi:hypothetical protein
MGGVTCRTAPLSSVPSQKVMSCSHFCGNMAYVHTLGFRNLEFDDFCDLNSVWSPKATNSHDFRRLKAKAVLPH